jgi:TRAP-type transport system periplasmic protein
MTRMTRALPLVLLLLPSLAAAEPVVLRMSAPAPEGTGWARLLREMAGEIDAATNGAVKMKWYFGSITGDELQTLARVKLGQLDGFGSGGMACERVIPSMKVTRLIGVFQNRDEATYVARKLEGVFEDEAQQAGFQVMTVNGMGPDIIFSKKPIRSWADLKAARVWRWDLDETSNRFAREMGLTVVPRALEDAGLAFDRGELDTFISIPQAALAFQWTTRARHVTNLRVGFLWGCILLSNRAFDRLTSEQQQVVKAASVKLGMRWDAFGSAQDAALLGPLAKQQGMTVEVPSEVFRAELFRTASEVRNRIGASILPAAMLDRVMRLLADYRAEHAQRE